MFYKNVQGFLATVFHLELKKKSPCFKLIEALEYFYLYVFTSFTQTYLRSMYRQAVGLPTSYYMKCTGESKDVSFTDYAAHTKITPFLLAHFPINTKVTFSNVLSMLDLSIWLFRWVSSHSNLCSSLFASRLYPILCQELPD